MEGFQQERASEDASRESGRGYGRFLVELAELLTIRIVLDLATYFDFPRARYEELQRCNYPGKLMSNHLQERGFISASGISPLIKALEDLKLDGVKNSVLSSYKLHTSDNDLGKSKKGFLTGQLEKLKFYLKLAYERLYRAIQPIPYIRDRLFCVNEVFVEGGIEFNDVSDKSGYSGELTLNQNQTRNKSLKSYTELFDDDIVPSKRVIVEGEPGYGKSTLTLQAAYDWCERKSSSLKGAELLILLPLRLLKGVTSFYEAIKLFILPSDCTLTTSDIEGIISSCSSVVIILDGYDEYPDMNNDLKSHIKEIIKGKMFSHFKVILSTRSGCLPQNLDPRTIRVRLTGFDEDARDRYVRMAVVGGSSDRTKDIRQNLEKNPIMCDLCQVPLFFVMFAHMAHESADIYKCNSVTSFFKYMIHCFYSHMWKKGEEMGAVSRSDTADKRRLYKLAFDGLTGGEQNIVWEKIEFCREVGTECFEELIRIGILVEEKILELNMTTELSVSEYIQEKTIVRFYHKLFAEWYAAHYVSERASSFFAFFLSRTLRRVNPIDLQFVFRFACGLKPSCTKRIVNYLRKIDGGKSFATLCILEQTGGTDDILDTVRDMCSTTVEFSSWDSQLLHRSRMQLFDIAAKNQIPISSVSLVGCFQSVDLKEECLCLSSGLQLPRLDTLKKLEIYGYQDLRDKARDILDYSARCVALTTLRFRYYALLPRSFEDKDVLARLHGKNCKVDWYTICHGRVKLNLQTGKWEKEDGQEMTDDEYRREIVCSGAIEDSAVDENKMTSGYGLNRSASHDLFNEMFVNEEGGILSIPEADICLEIPPEALTQGRKIKIKVPLECDHLLSTLDASPRLTPLIICEPEGIQFLLPVKLTLPHCAVIKNPKHHILSVQLGTKNKRKNEWTWKPESVRYTLTRKSCTIFLTHFTGVNASIGSTEAKILRVIPYAKLRSHKNTMALTLWFSNDLESDFKSVLLKAEGDRYVSLDSYDTFRLGYAKGDENVHVSLTDVSNQWITDDSEQVINVESLSRTNKSYRDFRLHRSCKPELNSYVYFTLRITQKVGGSQKETTFALRKRIFDLTRPISLQGLYFPAEKGQVMNSSKENPTGIYTAVPYIDPMKHSEDDIILTLWVCPFDSKDKAVQRLQKEQELHLKRMVKAENSFALSGKNQTVTTITRFFNDCWNLDPGVKEVETERIQCGSRVKFQFIGKKKRSGKDDIDNIELEVTFQDEREKITFNEEIEMQQLLYEGRSLERCFDEEALGLQQGARCGESVSIVSQEKLNEKVQLNVAIPNVQEGGVKATDDDLKDVFLVTNYSLIQKYQFPVEVCQRIYQCTIPQTSSINISPSFFINQSENFTSA